MPQAMFLIGWDDNHGSVVEAKYPAESEIKEDNITHYLSTLYGLVTSQSYIITDEKNTTLVCRINNDPLPGKRASYDFIFLVLEGAEKNNIEKYKMELKFFIGFE